MEAGNVVVVGIPKGWHDIAVLEIDHFIYCHRLLAGEDAVNGIEDPALEFLTVKPLPIRKLKSLFDRRGCAHFTCRASTLPDARKYCRSKTQDGDHADNLLHPEFPFCFKNGSYYIPSPIFADIVK